jgi:succinate dehydrogenase / fumarate reductase flavoprotein subunit
VWAPKNPSDGWDAKTGKVGRNPNDIPESERDYYLERQYPSFGNLVPRDIASRAAKRLCDEGRGVAYDGRGTYLDFRDSIKRLGKDKIEARYGNLFEMYERITGENPYETPMRMYPAPHYTMGGLWVDYNLMSNVPGLFVIGEANFSDHGANRLGASALMQGLADGYFIAPMTIGGYLAGQKGGAVSAEAPEFKGVEDEVRGRLSKLLSAKGKRPVDSFHRELGVLMIDKCGMSRTEEGLKGAIARVSEIRDEFWSNVSVPGSERGLNQSLEKAGRVADFLEFAEVMLHDALERRESCGGHFREESQWDDGEAKRDDANYCHVAAWEFTGVGQAPRLHKEPLEFKNVPLSTRSYK